MATGGAPPAASRLDKLLKLLDTGSDASVRKAAAQQITNIAKAHPQQLPGVIRKVAAYVSSRTWESRAAAAECLGMLAEHFVHHTPADLRRACGGGAVAAGGSSAGRDDTNGAIVKTEAVSAPVKTEAVSAPVETGAVSAPQGSSPRQQLTLACVDVRRVVAYGVTLAGAAAAGAAAEDPLRSGLRSRLGLEGPAADAAAKQSAFFKAAAGAGGKGGIDDEALSDLDDEDGDAILGELRGAGGAVPASLEAAEDPADVAARAEGLSARERNQLKRKAKAMARQTSNQPGGGGSFTGQQQQQQQHASAGGKKRAKLGTDGGGAGAAAAGGDAAAAGPPPPAWASALSEEEEWEEVQQGSWPFQRLCDGLLDDSLLHPCWEVRHGAAAALREVLRRQANSAAVSSPVAQSYPSGWCIPGERAKRALRPTAGDEAAAAAAASSAWLEDCAARLVCLLALDRFNDFVGDQVVAPVRETAAQALGAASAALAPPQLSAAATLLASVCEESGKGWQARHGGLLGLKYLLAAAVKGSAVSGAISGAVSGAVSGAGDSGGGGGTGGAAQALVAVALPAAQRGLQDPNDDVQAVAAEALVPLAPCLRPAGAASATVGAGGGGGDGDEERERLRAVRQRLWDMLLEAEDLSPATGRCMQLLCHIYTGAGAEEAASAVAGSGQQQQGQQEEQEREYNVIGMVPRLWPLLSHSLASVRVAAMRCLEALLLPPLQRTSSAANGAGCGGDSPVAAAVAPPPAGPSPPAVPDAVLGSSMWSLLQVLATDRRDTVVCEAARCWAALLAAAPPSALPRALGPADVLRALRLASLQAGTPVPAHLLRVYRVDGASGAFEQGPPSAEELEMMGSPEMGVGDGSAAALHVRMDLASALGGLGARWPTVAAAAAGSGGGSGGGSGRNPVVVAAGELLASDSAAEVTVAALVSSAFAQQQRLQDGGGGSGGGSAALAPLVAAQLQLLADGLPQQLREVSGFHRRVGAHTSALMSVAGLSPEAAAAAGLSSDPTIAAEQLLHLQLPPTTASVRAELAESLSVFHAADSALRGSATAAVAAATVAAGVLPPKLNCVIKPLMASLRSEGDARFRGHVASALAGLVLACVGRKPCPNDRVIRNLCATACGDAVEAAAAAAAAGPATHGCGTALDVERQDALLLDRVQSGALTQRSMLQQAAPVTPAAGAGAAAGNGGDGNAALTVAQMGGEAALRQLAIQSGPGLVAALPQLWELMVAGVWPDAVQGGKPPTSVHPPQADPKLVMHCLHTMRVVGPCMHAALSPLLTSALPAVVACARHAMPAVRSAAAACAADLAAGSPEPLMPPLLQHLLPMLGAAADDVARLGAVEMLAALVAGLGPALAAYTVLLVVPLMRRMSDPLAGVRLAATQAFASVVALLPLAQGMPPPPGLAPAQVSAWSSDSSFLDQLLDNRHAASYQLPLKINATLRHYQQEGVNWLAFLRRFGLHGVLADDMGLGKTLQATAIIAASMVEQRQAYKQQQKAIGIVSSSSGGGGVGGSLSLVGGGDAIAGPPLPSVIVCPTTLVSHWAHEIEKFVGQDVLRVLEYQGNTQERLPLRKLLSGVDVVVLSYEVLRSDVEWASSLRWDYCVLDEGHIIKNPKSKITMACKRLSARHRLLLSGTPVQNDVLELWSLFDFLMPGFMGTQRQFQARFGKAVQSARGSKKGSAEAEAGLLAAESLHKTVMPFVLRRTKEQVLSDLPPKIVQDMYCDPSPLQRALYEDFAKSKESGEVAGVLSKGLASAEQQQPHVFKTLAYLRKLCSHPLLVLDPEVEQHRRAVASVLPAGYGGDVTPLPPERWPSALRQLHSLEHAPKLLALRELLQECGIGGEQDTGTEALSGGGGPTHRVLVFAQLKSMLDLVAADVLTPMGASYARLDGGVPPAERFKVVQRFNSDPTIDVMLLTTQVGGLGLNLTSADVVIFLEHDWNPTKDLQAMDRAHRLGQTRTVNVYRLLTRGTMEEQVMSLQRFKTEVAAAVVNADNMSMDNMDTSGLLDMFGGGGGAAGSAAGGGTGGDAGGDGKPKKKKGDGLKAAVEGLGELWSEEQYKDFGMQE